MKAVTILVLGLGLAFFASENSFAANQSSGSLCDQLTANQIVRGNGSHRAWGTLYIKADSKSEAYGICRSNIPRNTDIEGNISDAKSCGDFEYYTCNYFDYNG